MSSEQHIALGLALAAARRRQAAPVPPMLALLRIRPPVPTQGQVQAPPPAGMAWLMPAWYWWELPQQPPPPTLPEQQAPEQAATPNLAELPLSLPPTRRFTHKPARPTAAPTSGARQVPLNMTDSLPRRNGPRAAMPPLPGQVPPAAARPVTNSGPDATSGRPPQMRRNELAQQPGTAPRPTTPDEASTAQRTERATTTARQSPDVRAPLRWRKRDATPPHAAILGRRYYEAAARPSTAPRRNQRNLPWRRDIPRPLSVTAQANSVLPQLGAADAAQTELPDIALEMAQLLATVPVNVQQPGVLLELVEQLVARHTRTITQEQFAQLQTIVREQLRDAAPQPDLRGLSRALLRDDVVDALAARLESKYRENQFRIGKLGRRSR